MAFSVRTSSASWGRWAHRSATAIVAAATSAYEASPPMTTDKTVSCVACAFAGSMTMSDPAKAANNNPTFRTTSNHDIGGPAPPKQWQSASTPDETARTRTAEKAISRSTDSVSPAVRSSPDCNSRAVAINSPAVISEAMPRRSRLGTPKVANAFAKSRWARAFWRELTPNVTARRTRTANNNRQPSLARDRGSAWRRCPSTAIAFERASIRLHVYAISSYSTSR